MRTTIPNTPTGQLRRAIRCLYEVQAMIELLEDDAQGCHENPASWQYDVGDIVSRLREEHIWRTGNDYRP